MKYGIVITGDIAGFTKASSKKREAVIKEIKAWFKEWAKPGYAEFFRGDSFQLLFEDSNEALKRSLQLRCRLKKSVVAKQKTLLDAKLAIGIGEISSFKKSVLDADGEAFHLSGRSFDKIEETRFRIVTKDEKLNKQLEIIADLLNVIIADWTSSQAEVVYWLLEGKTQQQMANELQIAQSAVNNRIKLARWKETEKTLTYIISLLNDLS